jgi:hypothetical protein
LDSRNDDGINWIHFKHDDFYIWMQSAPGRKDDSGRQTTLFHILWCRKQENMPDVTGRDFLFYQKFQHEVPSEPPQEIMISDADLKQCPAVCAERQKIVKRKFPVKKLAAVVICAVMICAVFVTTAIVAYNKGKQESRAEEGDKIESAVKKSREAIAKGIGMEKDNVTERDIIEHVKKLKENGKSH